MSRRWQGHKPRFRLPRPPEREDRLDEATRRQREDAMLDTKIVGGEIVDGAGGARFRGDVGVKDGRIVAIGEVNASARQTIDAAGQVVAPGFIDAHTHYDAQAFWDPTLSPSCYHGVTTVVGGFCGFSIAPLSKDSAEYLKPMLARVEGMPLRTLQAAVPWDWSSFGEFLGRLDGRIGLNAGFFVGHSAIRRMVMGQRAVGEKATADDLAQMKALLDRSLSEGALGFSTTVSPSHNDGDGNPVPSRWADHSEIIELAGVVRGHEGAGLELLPDLEFGPGMAELLTEASLAAQRPVNWNVLAVTSRPDAAEQAWRKLAVTDFARERSGEVIALTIPGAPGVYMNLYTGVVFDTLPGIWRELFKLPVAERIEKFKDAQVRKTMAADAARFPSTSVNAPIARFSEFRVVSSRAEQNKTYEGRLVGEIAADEGREPLDVMLAIAVEDGLKTVFSPNYGGHDHGSFELRGALWADDRTLIGGSDAGAHLDQIDTFAFSTELLQNGVRQHRVISLERAVHNITQRPAAYFGLVDRGVIALGAHADIVVFDAATVGRGPTYMRYDLPGGRDFRLYAEAIGISHVLVNGVEIVRQGEHTGALPGAVLRAGRDTRTPRLDALRRREPA
jgi:N-acyl-D-aspartate/D-glutamate deacylase